MTRAALVQVADTVTAMLRAAPADTFTQPFAPDYPQRSYADWDLPLEEVPPPNLGRLLCDVVPAGASVKTELEDRGAIKYKVPVDIVLRLKFGPNIAGRLDVAAVDPYVELVEQIHAYFCGERMALAVPDDGLTPLTTEEEQQSMSWESTDILAAYRKDHLRQYRQFTGIVRVTFSFTKDK